ncbi:MAG: hypothetical protein KatS3mg038_0433 [Candidatus Kapaibacterium sp.]|nr:MAG: hypothetical protein KatS3mg038_0433 [Candidatus Kapabacteria bacterium]
MAGREPGYETCANRERAISRDVHWQRASHLQRRAMVESEPQAVTCIPDERAENRDVHR